MVFKRLHEDIDAFMAHEPAARSIVDVIFAILACTLFLFFV
jgi:hypothetical protein